MKRPGAPPHNPVPIGDIAAPPFVRLPNPNDLFVRRVERLRALAHEHQLGPYLQFLAELARAQHDLQDGLPEPDLPDAELRDRARQSGMPPIDRGSFTPDAAYEVTLTRLLMRMKENAMPALAAAALARVEAAAEHNIMTHAVLTDAIPVESPSDHVFVAAALQVHFARMASRLDPERLVPVGDGACPVCGAPPVATVVVGWLDAHGARFCACSLCATLWNYVRIKCSLCGSTEGISYQHVEGGPDTVKAETCERCGCYVKILHQHRDPAFDPVADDVATLGLDLLLRETGYRRGGVNPFLLGY
jgi:FdhE protein